MVQVHLGPPGVDQFDGELLVRGRHPELLVEVLGSEIDVVQARVLSAALVNRFFAWTETWGMVAAR